MFLNYLFLGLISALRPSADTLYHLSAKVPKIRPLFAYFSLSSLSAVIPSM